MSGVNERIRLLKLGKSRYFDSDRFRPSEVGSREVRTGSNHGSQRSRGRIQTLIYGRFREETTLVDNETRVHFRRSHSSKTN